MVDPLWPSPDTLAGGGHLQLVEPLAPSVGERIARLVDEELRMLGAGVGDHLPVELVDRVGVVRAERVRLERQRIDASWS